MIINVLTGAGVVGLHVDDIAQLIGVPERQAALQRLRYLAQSNLVEQKPGQIWKMKESADVNGNGVAASSEGQSNGTTTATTGMLPQATALPTINLPGIGKFSSYKNSLQEYCQKSKVPVPQYRTRHDAGVGFIGSVSFSTNSVTAKKAMPTSKEAEMVAAFEALKQLGYFSDEVQYEHTSVLRKRKDSGSTVDPSAPPAKLHCPDGAPMASSKSKLNEMAQKSKLPLPTYNTVTVTNGFFSTVEFNGRQFKSAAICTKKKDAEQSAAKVALDTLMGSPSDIDTIPQLKEADIQSMIAEARNAATKNPGALKSRLQEYCQRLKKELPKYTTQQNSDRSYFSSVEVDGVSYNGESQKSRKLAEISAAENALRSLGLMA